MTIDKQIAEKFSKVRLFAMDFDGILTDGNVYTDQHGNEIVRSSRVDSMGLLILRKSGILLGVISKETNPVVAKRCEKIKVQCWQGVESGQGKREILERITKEQGLSPEQVLYMGDDVNDFGPLEYAGVKVTVADAEEPVRRIATYVTRAKRGEHGVREVCNIIMEAQGINPRL